MFNSFLNGLEKFEVIVLVTFSIAFVIRLVIGYYQEKIGGKDILNRVKEYYRQKDEFVKQQEQLEQKKNDLKNKAQILDKKIASFDKEKQQFEEECKNVVIAFESEESQNQKELEFWGKMIQEHGYSHLENPLKHLKDVIIASSTKRRFLKFLKEEFPKSNSPKTVEEIHVELEELFKDTQYHDYVIEAYEDRAGRCNPVLVAFELYTCYNTKYDA